MKCFAPVLAAITLVGLSGCNIFAYLDQPRNDDELLSAARACVDQGDLECALDYYSQVSSAKGDYAQSEKAFAILDDNGVTMAAFATAFGSGQSSAGQSITKLAGILSSRANLDTRLGIFSAYQKTNLINNAEIRGLVRFITGIALVAEMLAEDVGTVGVLKTTDIARTPSSCATETAGSCFTSVPCSKIGKIKTGPVIGDLDQATITQMSGASPNYYPTFNMINSAITEVQYALTSEIPATSGLGGAANIFSSNLLTSDIQSNLPLDPTTSIDSACFRWGLILNDIGE